MSKKVLVTGGAGFIGSHLVDKLVEEGHDVRVLDSLDKQVHISGKLPNYFNNQVEFVKGDVRNKDDFREALKDIDVVFHEAGAVGVGQSMYELNYYVSTNNIGTSNLLELLVNEEHSVKKVVVAASMSSYGEGLYKTQDGDLVDNVQLRSEKQMSEGKWEPLDEQGRPLIAIPTPETKYQNCNSIYALTKKDQEEMVLMIGKTYGIPSIALRYFNVAGPRQSLSNPYTGVTAIFMSRIKNNNAPIVYEDGLQTRDFISVHDIVQANILAMQSKNGNYESYNVGTGKPITIKKVAETIARLYGSDIMPKVQNKFRKGDVRHCFADISKIKSKLGFEPKHSFEETIKEIIEWSKNVEAVDKFEEANNELKSKGLV